MFAFKVGGLVLAGVGGWILANKALNIVDKVSQRASESSKWRAYYKCWSKSVGNSPKEDPIAPGYSITTRPIGADYEIVKDPSGKDNSANNSTKSENSEALAKAIVSAAKAVTEKAMDNLKKPVETQEEAKEGQTEASEEDIYAGTDTDGDNVVDFDPKKGE